MTKRYFRWEFDIALVWTAEDGDATEAKFVWDSDSQVATPKLLTDPLEAASYLHEVGDEDRYEVERDDVAAVKVALALKSRLEHDRDDDAREVQRLREELRELRSRLLAEEERRKLTGDALHAEGEAVALRGVVRIAREYREKTMLCLDSPDCTIQDEEERDALEDALDAAIAALPIDGTDPSQAGGEDAQNGP